jgi:hypothetical protein
MNAPKQTGGPAFPAPLDTAMMAALTPSTGALGMTLRDYFAAKALQGMCAQVDMWGCTRQELAKTAYEMADLMLAERGAA